MRKLARPAGPRARKIIRAAHVGDSWHLLVGRLLGQLPFTATSNVTQAPDRRLQFNLSELTPGILVRGEPAETKVPRCQCLISRTRTLIVFASLIWHGAVSKAYEKVPAPAQLKKWSVPD